MSLAGADVPNMMQGKPFMGVTVSKPRRYVYGARSRADDMFEVSRSVFDGRYLYVRHFMPHLPYIQPGVIFDDRKRAFRELRRLNRAGLLDRHAAQMWSRKKPVEELYDLQHDPHELENLAGLDRLASVKDRLASALSTWVLDHRDSGFLPEAEYQIRAAKAGITPFEIVQDPAHFDLRATFVAASQVGDESVPLPALQAGLEHGEAGVRYWSAVALQVRGNEASSAKEPLLRALGDESPAVRIAVAEALFAMGHQPVALKTLGEVLLDDRPYVALQAARALALIGAPAKPLVPVMKRVIDKNRSKPGSPRPYKDFNYASFTGWALETALAECGETVEF
jgi:hypothetical protein